MTAVVFTSSGMTSQPGMPPALTMALKSAVDGILCMGCTGDLPLAEQLHVVLYSLDETKLTHLLSEAHMQPTRVHIKKQIWQAKLSVMDHKCCVHFTIIGHSVDLNQIL